MSTAGKVLTVLVMLLAIVWVLLSASVTQLNRNWTKQVAENKTKIEDLTEKNLVLEHDVQAEKDKTFQEQAVTENDLAVLESRQSDLEKARAQELEAAARAKFQLETTEAALKGAKADQEQRVADLNSEREAKKTLEADVEKLMSENGKLLAQLAQLREKFKTALKTNRQKAGLPSINVSQ
jgi:chromosome segregation ATPase